MEVGRKSVDDVLVCLDSFVDCLGVLMGQQSGYVDFEGTRYWRLIDWLMSVPEEIKISRGRRDLKVYKLGRGSKELSEEAGLTW